MEIIRDTVLLPGLQYIMSQMKANWPDGIEESFDGLICGCVVPEAEDIFKSMRQWFLLYQSDKDEARQQLEGMIQNCKSCGQCGVCYNCLLVFLIELYEQYYHDDRFTFTKTNIKNDNYYVFDRLPDNIYKHLDSKMTAAGYYWEHCKNLRRAEMFRNKLVVLKGMSSSTPAILNGAFNTQAYHGGGLFFNWEGCGIAIDPGHHFVENMHRIGLSILDIDVVVITHEHIDHTNDIRLLDDLNYSLLQSLNNENEEHIITWYVDKLTYEVIKTLQKSGSGFSDKTNKIYNILPKTINIKWEERTGEVTEQRSEEIEAPGIELFSRDASAIIMNVERTFHEIDSMVSKSTEEYMDHTFASSFELKSPSIRRKIFYSSDTCFKEPVSKCAAYSDIVIANISSVYEDDLLKIKEKRTHLGYMGCYKILESMRKYPPSLFLLSEFWNAKADIRYDVARYLMEDIIDSNGSCFKKTKIIPTEIGMQVDLEKLMLQCSVCKEFSDDVIIVRPEKEYDAIKILCKKCYY